MCGVVGVFGLNGAAVDPAVVRRMSWMVRHRGPDDEGIYTEPSIGLGFRRLSILDLSPAGHQPMFGPDGDTVIVFNGEIYNYIELRDELQSLGHRFRSQGDTEVLLHAYLQWGQQCLDKLNGMWAFLIYDRRRGVLFGSRDRLGKKPLYRYQTDDRFFIASEIKAILASGYYRGEVNWNRAASFFLEDSFFESEANDGATFYTDISQIPAGSAFELDVRGNWNWKEWRYWSLDSISDAPVTDPAESYYELFSDAVRLRLRSDVPVGIFLSGGLDSTSIACAVGRMRDAIPGGATAPLLAFSYQAREFDESAYINETVQQTGVELVSFRAEPRALWDTLQRVLWYQDEPIHSLVAVITFELSRLAAARGVKVILNGGGPDETLGYPSFFRNHWQTLVTRGRIRQAWREIGNHHALHGGCASRTIARLLVDECKAPIRSIPAGRQLLAWNRKRRLLENTWFTPELTSRFAGPRPSGAATLDSTLRRAVDVAPLPYYLRLEDRNSMAHSVEARMPFLDHRLVALAFRLPADWKMRGPWNKYVLRTAMRGRIPEAARSRLDKMGFPIPARRWFAEALYEPTQDLLGTQQLRERGIYRVDAIRKDLQRHRDGLIDVSSQLFNIVQFEIWSKLGNDAQTAVASPFEQLQSDCVRARF